MAVPKRRMSRSNTHSRRAQWKTTAPALAACSNRACRQPKPSHMVCPHCGKYDGRQVIQPA
ncbi:MAG: 50S ribosomal protein L32 [Pseudonocardiaceae bacterium]